MPRFTLKELFLLITIIAVFLGGWMARDLFARKQKRELQSIREWQERHRELIELTDQMDHGSWRLLQLQLAQTMSAEIEVFKRDFPNPSMEFTDLGEDPKDSDLVGRQWRLISELDPCHSAYLTMEATFKDLGPLLLPVKISSAKFEIVHIESLGRGGSSIRVLKSFTLEEWKQFRKNTPDILNSPFIEDCEM